MDHSGQYTLVRRVEDKDFSIDDLTHYSLLLLVGERSFQVCVIDTREGSCMIVEDYALSGIASPEQHTQTVYQLFEDHTLLMAGYWKTVKLAIKNQCFTLVPDVFFSSEKLPHYLTLSIATDAERDGFYHYRHVQSQAVGVFAANKRLIERVRSLYPSLDLLTVHHSSALIEGIQANRNFTYYRDLYLHVDQTYFSALVTEDNRLILYNQFPCRSPQEVLKYTLAVMNELAMDRNTSRVTLWANAPDQSAYAQLLYRYVRNLEIGTRPSYLKFSYAFDELPEHQYVDLYGLHICE